MTLTVHADLVQGSQEWLDARCGVLTASVVGKLITPATRKVASNDTSRGLIRTLACERITGHVDEVGMTSDMWRGVEEEPYARDHYAEHHAPVEEVGFMVREISGHRLGYSPDGLVGDDGLIEIKCPRPATHLATILADEVPVWHMAQIQCGLLVSGRKWLDFVSWSGGMPAFVKRVTPDPEWQTAIKAALVAFEAEMDKAITAYRAATDGLPATERTPDHTEMKVA